ncbi:MAG TPA: ABC transporter ATP-binding protein, partial [Dehalococcoidales bacterium]|nr:ABC transporter ATP-binding protein [Dehalococcoidales bacterium]
QKFRLLLIIFLMVLVALMEASTVALLVPLMNLVIGQAGALPGALGGVSDIVKNVLHIFHLTISLPVVLILVVLAFLVQSGFRMIMMHLQTRMLNNYEFSLVHRLFGGYFNSSWGFFVRNQAGSLVNNITMEAWRAVSAFKNALDFISSLLILIFYLILSITLSWQITIAGLLLSLIATFALRKFLQVSHKYGVGTSEINNEIQSYAIDKIVAAKLIKSSATEKQTVAHMDDIVRRRIRLQYLSQMNASFVQSLYFPVAIGIMALIVYVALVQIKLNPSIILVFTYIFFRLSPYFNSLQLAYQQSIYNLPAVSVIDDALKLGETMAEPKGDKAIQYFNREIVFDNVSFTYPGGAQVLNSVNLTIKKGESIAIIGESGEGKTTIIDLLLGLFTPTSGQILVDGVPLSSIDIASWRKLTGNMSQDISLFHDTIEANLKWMTPNAPPEKIESAAKAAYALDFIKEAAGGFKAIVGDRGVKLSGGQRQRLALARMIMQDPEIIILDEATSALDAESEAKVQESIDKLATDKTLIVVSHRTSMLRNISKVYQLKDGSISEVRKAED